MVMTEATLGAGPDSDPSLGDDPGNGPGHGHRQGMVALTVGAIGVVYGDIGTSPLYAMREALRPVAADGLERIEVLGVVSLLVWTLMLIVTVKYVMILLRADNHGEGGMLALYALTRLAIGRRSYVVLGLGIAGAALFFGDSVITPAVSILSAVEGIELVAPSFDRFILPVTIGIILGLFLIQRHGTHSISKFFGPVMMVWFLVMGISGAGQLSYDLGMLAAFNPYYGFAFLAQHGFGAFFVMGAIFLAVTGAEALYADLGHFGRPPIRNAWFALIFPALILNYLGQGALVQRNPDSLVNPFFFMVPASTLPAFVALATVATIIASQSVISGAFSLARAAVQLGLLPRLSIVHTSGSQSGQIYIPAVNWMLLVGVLAFVLNFRSSEALASAYGISVTGAMVVDTIMGIIYAHRGWRFSYLAILPLAVPLLGLETTFFISNMTKFFHGGYVPVALGITIGFLMWSWWRGTQHALASAHRQMVNLDSFATSILKSSAHKVPGTAIFFTADSDAVPPALMHNLKHNRVLHDQNVVLTIETARVPFVRASERVVYAPINDRFARVALRFGFMETPNVTRALNLARREGLKFDVMTTSFFLGRRKVVLGTNTGFARMLDRVFIALGRFATDPSDYFQLPRDRVVELGARISV